MSNLVIGIKKWARLNDSIAEYLKKGCTVNQLLEIFLSTEALARTICALDGLDYNIIYSSDFDSSSFEEIRERLTAALYPHVLAVKRDLQAKLLAKSLVEEANAFPQLNKEEAFKVFEDEHDLLIHDMYQQPIFSEPYNTGEGILEQMEKEMVKRTVGISSLYAGKSVITEETIDKWIEGRNLGATPQPSLQQQQAKATMESTRNVDENVSKEFDIAYYKAQFKNSPSFDTKLAQKTAKSAEQMFPILAIGDLHAPFIKDGYLDFCKQLEKTYKVQSTVFLGDIVDNHRLSRFPKSTKSDVWRTERAKAKRQLADWHYSFPNAYVMIGNHDERFAHRMHELELDDDVIPTLNTLYDLPTWKFKRSLNVGDLYYFTHGTGKGHGKIRENVLRRNISYVVGHFHNKFGQEYVTQDKSIIYCGCGVDTESYAFDYHAADDKNSITGAMIIYPSFVIPVPMFSKRMTNTVLSNEKE